MERPLGSFERAAVLTGERSPLVVVTVLHLVGRLPAETLRAALDRLQAEEPLLSVRVVATARRPRFVSAASPTSDAAAGDPAAIPLDVVPRRDDHHWLGVAEEELNRRFPRAAGPLLRCRLLSEGPAASDGGRHELLVTFHHAIVDAASAASFLSRLLALLAGDRGESPERDAAGEPSEAGARPSAGPPVEARLPAAVRGLRGRLGAARFLARELSDELRFRFRRRGGRRPPVAGGARCRPLPVELDRVETDALVHAARRRRVTLTGALSAALLGAVHRRLYGGESRPLRHIAFADLRPYLDPPVPADRLGCAVSMLRHTFDPPASGAELRAGFWQLAAEITRRIDRGSRRGDKFYSYLLSARAMRATLHQRRERMAATALSYSGVTTPLGPASGALELEDFHAFVSNLDLGPEYGALARLMDGRLQLDLVYLDSDMDEPLARELAGDVLDTLRAAGAGGEGR